jgi:hypothetical protein
MGAEFRGKGVHIMLGPAMGELSLVIDCIDYFEMGSG